MIDVMRQETARPIHFPVAVVSLNLTACFWTGLCLPLFTMQCTSKPGNQAERSITNSVGLCTIYRFQKLWSNAEFPAWTTTMCNG